MLLLHIYLFECVILLINCDYEFIFINLFIFQSSLILHIICQTATLHGMALTNPKIT